MSTVKLALYTGKKHLMNRLICGWAGSDFSHMELVVDGLCYSSSALDGGVRCKTIDLTDGNWLIVPLPGANPARIESHYLKTRTRSYGYWDLFTGQVLHIGVGDDDRGDFCSEWCFEAATGIPVGKHFSPAVAAVLLISMFAEGNVSAILRDLNLPHNKEDLMSDTNNTPEPQDTNPVDPTPEPTDDGTVATGGGRQKPPVNP